MVLGRPTVATSTTVDQATDHHLPILLTPRLQHRMAANHKDMVDRDTDNLDPVMDSLRVINHNSMADRVMENLMDTTEVEDRVMDNLRDTMEDQVMDNLRDTMEDRVMDNLRDTMEDQDTIKGMEVITTIDMADAVL